MIELRPRPSRRARQHARLASYAITAIGIAVGCFTVINDSWSLAPLCAMCVATVVVWMYRFEVWRSDALRKSERRVMGAVTEVTDAIAGLERKLELVDVDTAYYEITAELRKMRGQEWPGRAA